MDSTIRNRSAAPSDNDGTTPKPERLDVHFHLPTPTIVKILIAALITWAGIRLSSEFILLIVSIVIAVALHPLVERMEKRGTSRGTAVVLMAAALVLMAVLTVTIVFTSLADQITRLVHDFPSFKGRIDQRLPAEYPMLKNLVSELFALPYSPEVAAQLKRPLALGSTAVSGVMAVFFTLILTLYFLLDGRRLYAWLLAYIPRRHRDKMAVTVDEVSEVVYAYVRGQVITSLLFSFYVAVVLSVFRVPAAVPLALLAGFCDVIPVVGIIIATIPATLLALTVSPAVALAVLSLYIVYHLVESYFIVPRIYGQRLRLSTLAVLLALVAGNTLAGLIGAVLVLPLVAAYPIIERIWLARYLNPEVIRDHKALARSAETGNETAVDAVLQGQKHPWEGATGNVPAPWLSGESPGKP